MLFKLISRSLHARLQVFTFSSYELTIFATLVDMQTDSFWRANIIILYLLYVVPLSICDCVDRPNKQEADIIEHCEEVDGWRRGKQC